MSNRAMKTTIGIAKRLMRLLCVILLVMAGSTALVRIAPGYLSDAREMDARYASEARARLATEAGQSHSVLQMLEIEVGGWVRGDAGISRQFDVPVSELIRPRLAVTGSLISRSILWAWILAVCASILASAGRKPSPLWQTPATALMAIPTAAMATVCILADTGGPVLVMALLLAARDFKFLHRALRKALLDTHVLQARAQGLGSRQLLTMHIMPSILPQLSALISLSIVTALSAIVPVEVIFNVPGLGQLAWNAALNRDLPVLLAITLILALAVTASGALSSESL